MFSLALKEIKTRWLAKCCGIKGKTQPAHKRTEILEPFTLFTSFAKVSMSGGNNFQQQPKKNK